MTSLREHTGHGWGNPVDPTMPDRWLAAGRICDYDPARDTTSVLLVSTFDGVARGSAYINAAQERADAAVIRARGSGKFLRDWMGLDSIGSRFD